MKLVKPSHGAWRLFLPCVTISPSEAEPGGNPNPRKSRPVNKVTAPLRLKGKKVMVATIAFGRTCLYIMTIFETPSPLAARTKSKFLARRNSARTTPTYPIQLKSNKMPINHQKLGCTTLAKIINRYNLGIDCHISIKR